VQNTSAENLRRRIKEPGVAKVLGVCDLAKSDGFEYVWIDSCCIDKSSSAELSEAINSMFEWYSESVLCYAYLIDVERRDRAEYFKASRWFKRGWSNILFSDLPVKKNSYIKADY